MLIQDFITLSKRTQYYTKKKMKHMGLSGMEQNVCTYIYLHKEINQDNIAKALMIDKGNMAKLMASLEKQGLIQRTINSQNRREYLIMLTESGQKMIGEILAVCEEWTNRIMEDLSEEEKIQFLATFDKIIKKSQKVMDK